MIYLCAGLYAEGPTDYRFLMPLLDRLLHEVASEVLSENFRVADTIGIDAPPPRDREIALPAAIEAHWDECTLFVIHSDGAGDPEGIRRTAIEPGLQRTRERHPDLAAAACVPVREVEAWMLADREAFRALLRSPKKLDLPRDPEAELDPKKTLARILVEAGARSSKLADLYAFFGVNVHTEALRGMLAFHRFRLELADAIRTVARPPR